MSTVCPCCGKDTRNAPQIYKNEACCGQCYDHMKESDDLQDAE